MMSMCECVISAACTMRSLSVWLASLELFGLWYTQPTRRLSEPTRPISTLYTITWVLNGAYVKENEEVLMKMKMERNIESGYNTLQTGSESDNSGSRRNVGMLTQMLHIMALS